MSAVSRTMLAGMVAACVAQGCTFPEATDTESGRDLQAPERAATEPTREFPAPRWSGDPAEDEAQTAIDAADTAAERDGDELVSRARPASTGAPGTASACDGDPLGSFDYCSVDCVCDASEGDCDADDECATGLVCMRDTGALFGFDPEVDVCMEQCDPGALGTPDFCSTDCPCEHGQGDCDEDYDCAAGNVCAKNVGADFGFAPDVDVCVDACDPILNGTYDYCSSDCPCEHGQSDCDRDSDCAPGHVCAHNVGADFGFPDNMDVCVGIELPHESFAGRVIDHRGIAISGATVSINQVAFVSGPDGAFSLSVEATADERYVINVTKNGHVPRSRIHTGAGVSDLEIVLNKAQVIAIDTTQPVDVEDHRGTRLALPANALVDANGEPPKGPVTVQIHTYDITEEELVGNMEAVDENGEVVMLESIGAISADFVGAGGERFQLAPGQTAQIAVELPPGVEYSGPIPMWYYDEEQGRWIEEGVGYVQDGVAVGEVSHFSVWNFDVKRDDPACVKVLVPAELVPPGASVEARVVVPPPFPANRTITLDSGDNALYNLPPNTDVEIFVPASATEPLATFSTGAPWGGRGAPPAPYDACNSEVTLPVSLPGQLVGYAVLQGRTVHQGTVVRVLDDTGAVVATATTASLGQYTLEVDSGTYDIELVHPGYLPVRMDAVEVLGGKLRYLPCVQLLGGDVNEDAQIDSADITLVLDAQGSSANPGDPLDVNGDGVIDSRDLLLVQSNLGKAGPIAPDTADSQCPSATTSKVVTGGYHTCALQEGGVVRCWGDNDVGQLGYGHTSHIGDDEALVFAGPVDVGGPVRDLVAGDHHTCALLDSGAVRCWGANWDGQLGYGHTSSIGDNETPASAGNVDVGGSVVQLTAGYRHTCARLDSGAVRCWGHNNYGQLGYGHTSSIGDNESPSSAGDVEVGGTVVQLTTGYRHTCARLDSGAVRCWGHNNYGQLGYGHTSTIGDDEIPASADEVDVGDTVTELAANYYHTCGRLSSGAIRCWGNNGNGQLGYGHTSTIGDDETPASAGDVDVGGTVAELTAGYRHTCARLDSGAIRCWGYNAFGQLGYGHTSPIGDDETPASAGDAAIGGLVTQLSGGGYHTCATLNTGGIRCWGSNDFGQLGYGHRNYIGDNETPASAGDVPLF